jgi:hypothetical protein
MSHAGIRTQVSIHACVTRAARQPTTPTGGPAPRQQLVTGPHAAGWRPCPPDAPDSLSRGGAALSLMSTGFGFTVPRRAVHGMLILHRRTVVSSLAVATVLPSGLNARQLI